ncbi:zinc finger protein 592 [Micropterus salmoides]|uniref:zinc finger protein 592 n=1 Tax=Micropterus salmoides TaxID=27706 RepID=UPI0018ED6A41|nr:zinc finger protein 592 [Micropterus salmoides]XP_038562024.1 zinc finger protein 592 [Micropterus salmoides]
MGDMKTPDFDDLLAAFDIPDATGLDAKEPIHESHEETESPLKHTGICLDDSLLSNQADTTADIPAVSVIVKNTRRQESLEGFGPALQNGIRGQDASIDSVETTNTDFSKSFVSALNGESSRELLGKAPIQHKPDGTPIFSQSLSHFSPISSPESEDTQCSRDEMHPKQERPCFPEASILVERSIPDNPQNMDLSMFDDCPKDSDIPKNTQRSREESSRSEEHSEVCVSNETNETPRIHSALPPQSGNQNFEANCNSGTPMDVPTSCPQVKSQTSKLSSCLEALVSLNARKDPREHNPVQNDSMKASPKVTISPRSPRSPFEAVKRLTKPSDSPVSICSDSSSKASPAVASGSPPAIPRVRIKTIKTTSGQIKRTVTSVLPDSETDDVPSAYESSPSQSMISEDSYCNMSPHQSQSAAVDGIVGLQTKVTPASSSSPKVRHKKSEANARRPGLTQSTTIFHNTSGPVKRSVAHQGQKPKRGSSTSGHTTNTSFLPKAMHLASLNLVPHSVAASVAARSTSHQETQHALSCMVYSTVPLVHQVKTAKPFPHTSVPNTAAGTLNRLLNNANPVPTYVPNLNPPPESNISLPPRGYCCLECGDSFVVERSLAYHYSRRSVHFEVGCMHCAKTMVFFNKCALLAHAREHKNNGMVMQCTQLHMKPIAVEQMFVPMSTEPVNPSPLPSPKSQPVLPLYPDNVIRHRLRCLECNKQLPDYKALAGHYQRLSEDVEGLTCKVCSMLLPNKCSFRAHERIHAHKSPYCCPECGALSRSADIQKHVKENCLHYARKAWYKCLHCDMVFKTLEGQKTHIEEKHCEVFYKCSICPVAFKTSDGCEVHLENKHSASKISPQLIFKCSCETVFKKKPLLFQHFHQNANMRVTCVFKCPECNSVFPQKQLLMQHFKDVHVGNMTAETEKSSTQTDDADWYKGAHSVQQQKSRSLVTHKDSPRKKADQDSRPRVKPTGWTCGDCLQWFPERESYVSHVKTNHGKPVKKYPCRHCEQSFNSTTSLRRHIRNEHDGKKKIYTCWYCMDTKTTFTTSVTLKNHIGLMHGIKNPDLRQMPKTAIQESKKDLSKGLVSERHAVDTQVEARGGTFSLEAPSAKRLKTQFRCSKCGFITDSSTQFQQHIPQHKTDENTPQCLHCGLCFTSVLSLNRHLFIVHKVKDPEEEEVKEAKVREKDQDNQQVRSADTDEVNDLLLELNEPEADEPASLRCDKTADCNLKLRTHSQTHAVSLR